MEIKISIPEFLYEAFYNEAKYTLIASGRRTGKTYNAVQWLIQQLLLNPNTKGLWVDTVQGNLDAYVKRYFKPILSNVWHLCYYNERKSYLELPNKTFIDFRSAQKPENMEGFEYEFIVINEAGIVLRHPSLWYNTIYPMAKGKDTKVKIIGTPKGKNLFFNLTVQAINEEDYAFYQFSASDSPFWDKVELKKIKRVVPQEVWQQEYMARFVDGGGSVFRNISRIIHSEGMKDPEKDTLYVMGVDLAKHVDFTVLTVAELETGKIVYIDRFNQVDWSLQKARIVATSKRFNNAQIILDSTGIGDTIYDDLVNNGIYVHPYKFTAPAKKLLIRNLILAIENKSISIPDYDILISELELFEIQKTPSGNISYNAPEGMHDDTVDSLALVNHLLQNVVEEEEILFL